MEAEYNDELITIDSQGITIKDYYFPLSTQKTIPWSRLKSAHAIQMTFWTGKYKTWGMGLLPYWFNCDSDRSNKTIGFVLDTGSFIKAAVTPSNPAQMQEILSRRKFLI